MYRLQFSKVPLALPWYRVADAIGKDTQINAEEIADRINEALDDLDKSKPAEQRPPLEDVKALAKRVRRNVSQLISLLREEKHFWVQESARGGERISLSSGT